MYHQHVIYSCDLDDTRQQMACRATISKIWQNGGAWEYDILFAEPSDGDDGRFGVPEDNDNLTRAQSWHGSANLTKLGSGREIRSTI